MSHLPAPAVAFYITHATDSTEIHDHQTASPNRDVLAFFTLLHIEFTLITVIFNNEQAAYFSIHPLIVSFLKFYRFSNYLGCICEP